MLGALKGKGAILVALGPLAAQVGRASSCPTLPSSSAWSRTRRKLGLARPPA